MTEKLLVPPLGLKLRQIMRHPLPHHNPRYPSRVLRSMVWLAQRFVVEIENDLGVVGTENDPMIVVLNHNQRLEAVLVPALLTYLRDGKTIHFLADWPMMLIPGVGVLYRRNDVILLTHKNAKFRFFNRFKSRFDTGVPAQEQALNLLRNGSSIGVFPEATINRDPQRLMRGSPGAAKMALQTGVPILPIGIRFPYHPVDKPISDFAKMKLVVGKPITPSHPPEDAPKRRHVHELHCHVMTELAKVSGKSWDLQANKRRKYVL
ncbi:lysophospholipid acyltransferase family protein [Acanthopleuribacter pedis]|uniref:1-acyl-sn-glycerol-3-phosphate acyltransferase n=1 Tax=Acanthopleuribacter pedis TaxID=442870 RepID=A0A8J7QRM3_9BACT|nr:lysophospholipid acyltransferase family protein [Acanthopleuribacter pedis]MBO1322960.1 1-acyl-sn-glycerol-3-phosphate acyltransferase [Acanthopleuribacter pedis]